MSIHTNQIDAGDRLLEALADREIDVSLRDLIEAMSEVGLRFGPGSQADTMRALDEMDGEG